MDCRYLCTDHWACMTKWACVELSIYVFNDIGDVSGPPTEKPMLRAGKVVYSDQCWILVFSDSEPSRRALENLCYTECCAMP